MSYMLPNSELFKLQPDTLKWLILYIMAYDTAMCEQGANNLPKVISFS